MQTNNMAEKKRVLYDEEEIPGLVSFAEISLERAQLEVPEFDRIRRISSGILTIPPIEVVYKLARDSETLQFFTDYYFQNLEFDVTIIRTDAAGVEFARTLLPDTQIARYAEPAFDAANPVYAQVAFTLLPWDVIPIASQ